MISLIFISVSCSLLSCAENLYSLLKFFIPLKTNSGFTPRRHTLHLCNNMYASMVWIAEKSSWEVLLKLQFLSVRKVFPRQQIAWPVPTFYSSSALHEMKLPDGGSMESPVACWWRVSVLHLWKPRGWQPSHWYQSAAQWLGTTALSDWLSEAAVSGCEYCWSGACELSNWL